MVADVLKGPSSIDVLVEVTSALLARISSQDSLWQLVAWTGFWVSQNSRKNGAKIGAEILAYENDDDDLLITVLWRYAKLAGFPIDNLIYNTSGGEL